uniref:Reverse transcriptase domain-containing protein n=1 Tax=Aegilops tauschii subsp. strangulata TaxID=200361 RepID=A0A453EYD0_AEGTS
ESDITAVKEILGLFGGASGLKVNYAKSSATVLHWEQVATEIITGLGCTTAALPVTYLGIPLTTRRPSAGQLQPLVDRVAGRLPTWKAWLMNRADRLALVKSVLCARCTSCLLLPPRKKLCGSSRRFNEDSYGLGEPSPTAVTAM